MNTVNLIHFIINIILAIIIFILLYIDILAIIIFILLYINGDLNFNLRLFKKRKIKIEHQIKTGHLIAEAIILETKLNNNEGFNYVECLRYQWLREHGYLQCDYYDEKVKTLKALNPFPTD